jgi:hypothetical protein
MTDIISHNLIVLSGQSSVTGGESNSVTTLNPNGAAASYTPTNPFYLTDVSLGMDGTSALVSIRSAGDDTNTYRFNATIQNGESLTWTLKTPIVFPAGQELSIIVNYASGSPIEVDWTLSGYEASL